MSVLYVVVLTYVKPLHEIDAQLPAHVEWLKKGYAANLFLASGRKIPRTGGVILAKCDNEEQLKHYLAQDPFQRSGVANVELIPFEPSMMVTELQSLL
ncbi:TPA: YciI family protein [Citrobacter freundii]